MLALNRSFIRGLPAQRPRGRITNKAAFPKPSQAWEQRSVKTMEVV